MGVCTTIYVLWKRVEEISLDYRQLTGLFFIQVSWQVDLTVT